VFPAVAPSPEGVEVNPLSAASIFGPGAPGARCISDRCCFIE